MRPIASTNPARVVSFFGERISSERERRAVGRCEAIPFTFHRLQTELMQPKMAVDIVREWFAADDRMFEYRGGKFLANIFPEYPAAFDDYL